MQAHQKHTQEFKFFLPTSHGEYTFGGPGGIRTPVQDAFTLKGTSYEAFYNNFLGGLDIASLCAFWALCNFKSYNLPFL